MLMLASASATPPEPFTAWIDTGPYEELPTTRYWVTGSVMHVRDMGKAWTTMRDDITGDIMDVKIDWDIDTATGCGSVRATGVIIAADGETYSLSLFETFHNGARTSGFLIEGAGTHITGTWEVIWVLLPEDGTSILELTGWKH